jgi:hypothetical protein
MRSIANSWQKKQKTNGDFIGNGLVLPGRASPAGPRRPRLTSRTE